jgi:apolipoprotein N-acyltransferase
MRSVENGFTLFRCSSNGESGIVSPNGEILARTFTGSDPLVPALYQLPLNPRQETLFTAVGFIFEWTCLAVSMLYYLSVLLPRNLVVRSTESVNKALMVPIISAFKGAR